MESIILIIHLFLALAIIGLVLLQRSEGGGLVGGGGGGMGGLASPKGTANVLTRATGICAGLFFCTSLVLAIMAGSHRSTNSSILDALETPAVQEQPATSPEAPAVAPVNKDAPAAPIAK